MALRDELKAAKSEYWAYKVEVMRLASLAWVALAQKRLRRPPRRDGEGAPISRE